MYQLTIYIHIYQSCVCVYIFGEYIWLCLYVFYAYTVKKISIEVCKFSYSYPHYKALRLREFDLY